MKLSPLLHPHFCSDSEKQILENRFENGFYAENETTPIV